MLHPHRGLLRRAALAQHPVAERRQREGGALGPRNGAEAAIASDAKEPDGPRRVRAQQRVVHAVGKHGHAVQPERVHRPPRERRALVEGPWSEDAIARAAAARRADRPLVGRVCLCDVRDEYLPAVRGRLAMQRDERGGELAQRGSGEATGDEERWHARA